MSSTFPLKIYHAIFKPEPTWIVQLVAKKLCFQVATALVLAGPTLTLWLPVQALFASTSSYPNLAQRLPV